MLLERLSVIDCSKRGPRSVQLYFLCAMLDNARPPKADDLVVDCSDLLVLTNLIGIGCRPEPGTSSSGAAALQLARIGPQKVADSADYRKDRTGAGAQCRQNAQELCLLSI